jgi:hypothetical protein
MRNAPSVSALLPKLLGEHCSVLPRLLGSRSVVSERQPTDLASWAYAVRRTFL